jgi:pimeloyl-[acyl-carrier protein] methyl ester esterase
LTALGKTPILLLPGMDGTGESLAQLADRLKSVRLVRVISYPQNKPLGYDDLIALVAERTPKERFVILGESFSGPIAIEIAAADRRVAGLILASSFAWRPFPSIIAAFSPLLSSKWMPAKFVEAALLGSTGTPELRARLHKTLKELPQNIVGRRVAEVLRVDKQERLRQITCPVLCLQGRFDRLLGKRGVRQIASVKPHCQVVWFEASHMLLETHHDAAAEAINAFCDQLR